MVLALVIGLDAGLTLAGTTGAGFVEANAVLRPVLQAGWLPFKLAVGGIWLASTVSLKLTARTPHLQQLLFGLLLLVAVAPVVNGFVLLGLS